MKAFSLKGKLFAPENKISSVVALFETLQNQGQILVNQAKKVSENPIIMKKFYRLVSND